MPKVKTRFYLNKSRHAQIDNDAINSIGLSPTSIAPPFQPRGSTNPKPNIFLNVAVENNIFDTSGVISEICNPGAFTGISGDYLCGFAILQSDSDFTVSSLQVSDDGGNTYINKGNLHYFDPYKALFTDITIFACDISNGSQGQAFVTCNSDIHGSNSRQFIILSDFSNGSSQIFASELSILKDQLTGSGVEIIPIPAESLCVAYFSNVFSDIGITNVWDLNWQGGSPTQENQFLQTTVNPINGTSVLTAPPNAILSYVGTIISVV